MKNVRAKAAVLAAGLTCVLLISGCGAAARRADRGPASEPTATAPAAPAADGSGATGSDEPLTAVDDLLRQLDEQVSADSSTARDSD